MKHFSAILAESFKTFLNYLRMQWFYDMKENSVTMTKDLFTNCFHTFPEKWPNNQHHPLLLIKSFKTLFSFYTTRVLVLSGLHGAFATDRNISKSLRRIVVFTNCLHWTLHQMKIKRWITKVIRGMNKWTYVSPDRICLSAVRKFTSRKGAAGDNTISLFERLRGLC